VPKRGTPAYPQINMVGANGMPVPPAPSAGGSAGTGGTGNYCTFVDDEGNVGFDLDRMC